jgi:hypothetical protein
MLPILAMAEFHLLIWFGEVNRWLPACHTRGPAGNRDVKVAGTIYAADATLKITGNGTGNNIGCQYISKDLTIGGNGSLTVVDNFKQNPKARVLQIVE